MKRLFFQIDPNQKGKFRGLREQSTFKGINSQEASYLTITPQRIGTKDLDD